VAGLLLDPGLRKTSITLGAFKMLKRRGLVERMLVIAPLRVAYNVWPKEVEKWKDFEHFKVCVLHGKEKTEQNLQNQEFDIYVINSEGLPWLLTKPRFKMLSAELLVVDESSKFKNVASKRFKLLRPFLGKFRRRVILTGTPAPRNMLDLFGQVYIVDCGRALGQYITHYRNKYFDPSGFGGFQWTIREGAAEQINESIKPYFLRLQAEDYIDMPELMINDIIVDLPEEARKTYDEMEDVFMSLVADHEEQVFAPTAAAARIKCWQIAGGGIFKNSNGTDTPVGNKYLDIHNAKLEALEEYLEELNGKPVMVMYWFSHELERIKKYLGGRFGSLPCLSECSAKAGEELIQAWNRGEVSVMLAQPSSISHGLNLQEGGACNMLWYSLPDDLDVYDQGIRRIRRSGNDSSTVVVSRILARNTVDIAKSKMLEAKDVRQKTFLDAMISYRRKK